MSSNSQTSSGSDSDGPAEDTSYGVLHQHILNTFISAGTLTGIKVRKLFTIVIQKYKVQVDLKDIFIFIQKVVREINAKIAEFNMVIKAATCEFNGKISYMLVLTVEHPLIKMKTKFTQAERVLFQSILNKMLQDSDDFTVPHMSCITAGIKHSSVGTYKVEDSERFIKKMIRLKYFAECTLEATGASSNRQEEEDDVDKSLTPGTRCIIELENMLSKEYPGSLITCSLCNRKMLHGYKCSRADCDNFLHFYCYRKFILTTKNCPNGSCNESWEDASKMIRRRKSHVISGLSDNEEEQKSNGNVTVEESEDED